MTYTNPILCGFYPDPSICRVGTDYYLACSSFAYFPGIPIFHSTDLVHWTLLTYVLNRPSQFNPDGLGVSKGVFAPTIRYHQGLFYLTCTLVDAGGNFLVTATDPAGPWSDPIWLPVNGIDPSLFFDEGGDAWLVYNSVAPDDRPLYNGHRTIRLQRFEAGAMKLVGEERILVDGGTNLALQPRWVEGPHLYRRNGWYYLLTAEGGTGYDHAVVIFRSRSLEEAFVPYECNPLLAGDKGGDRPWPITSAGHADLVDTPEGHWHAVFLACRPYQHDHYNTGRETFLVPVDWQGDWPRFNPGQNRIRYAYPLPMKAQAGSQAPYSGNFSWTEDFRTPRWSADLFFLRTPRMEHYKVEAGGLALRLAAATLDGRESPAFLCRRQQHLHARACIRVAFEPGNEGELAGLVVFQDPSHFYFLGIRLREEKQVALYRSVLIPRRAGEMDCLAFRPVGPGPIELSIVASAATYRFLMQEGSERPVAVGPALPADFLSTCTAGGFTGCVFGIYATASGQESINHLLVEQFSYEGADTVWSDQDPGS